MKHPDRIHSEWCMCPACRPLAVGERASQSVLRMVWGGSITCCLLIFALAVVAVL